MKNVSIFTVGIVILGLFIIYSITFQVRFNEMALVTTFGKADSSSVINRNGTEAGLHWKWPWPIQHVRLMEARLRTLEDQLEQQETKDKHVVILKAYLTWRIVDPLEFQRSFHTAADATLFLRDRLRNARAEIGTFTFDQLTNTDPKKLRLADAENNILARIQTDLAGKGYGIAVCAVGIKRILLPEQITTSVFERMRQTRRRLAQNARSEGQAFASSIRAKARSDQERILAFAERKAQSIRAEGDAAAAAYYRVFAENEELAVFMRELETLESVLENNATFIVDTKIEPFHLLKDVGSGASTDSVDVEKTNSR